MRRDLLRTIAEEKDVTNAIVLTHNIDFVFVQTMVLSALRRCGHPSFTIFADASCAAASFAHQAPVLRGLGVRYRVVPLEMRPGFRFHAKALLLSGPTSATLYVGSGNLTFGGWRENAEVWIGFDSRADGTAPFAAFLRYLTAVVERVALPEAVRAEVEEAFDPKTHAWAAELDEPAGLLGKVGNGPPLLEQMLGYVVDGVPERVTVCAPYFDADAEALSTIVQRSGAAPVTVLVQPGRTGLTGAGWNRVAGGGARLRPMTFQHKDDQGKLREAFLHAKFYALERAGRVTIFAGSANCSRAALTIPGEAGNAELMAVREMGADEFQAAFMTELVATDGSPGLAAQPAEAALESAPGLRVLGASYEGGQIRVAYAPTSWRITACLADGTPAPFRRIADGAIGAELECAPRQVLLEGTDGSATVRSAAGWVDHEWELRATARGRSVSDAIRSRVRAGQWGVGAWSEVLEVFCAHLRYLPARLAEARGATSGSNEANNGSIEYSAMDVFAAGYGLPSLSSQLLSIPGGAEQRIRSLQQLLLRWFGLPTEDADDVVPIEPDGNADDVVDSPEELPTRTNTEDAAPSEHELQRVQRLVEQLTEAMTSAEFLRERPSNLLGADLKVASALLRVALREGWLGPDAFFQITHEIWMRLFFDADGDGRGWLQRRYESAASPGDFAATMRSPELLAALVAWALEVPQKARTPAHARFGLAAALAVDRLPWLWDGVDDELVCRELTELLARTGASAPGNSPPDVERVGELWLRLLQRGHALRRLERALASRTPAQLAPRIREKQLAKGELLWQGIAGFCVVAEPAQRAPGLFAALLPLRAKRERGAEENEKKKKQKRSEQKQKPRAQAQDATGAIRFSTEVTVPLAALLDPAVLPLTDDFGDRPREVLRAFLAELAEGFARGNAGGG